MSKPSEMVGEVKYGRVNRLRHLRWLIITLHVVAILAMNVYCYKNPSGASLGLVGVMIPAFGIFVDFLRPSLIKWVFATVTLGGLNVIFMSLLIG